MCKSRDQIVVVGVILAFHKLMGLGVDGFELFGCCHAGQILFLVACVYHIFERCHTHHEKFIQIGGCDREEFQTVQQRNGLVLGFLQDTKIKFEPAKLAVIKIFRFLEF